MTGNEFKSNTQCPYTHTHRIRDVDHFSFQLNFSGQIAIMYSFMYVKCYSVRCPTTRNFRSTLILEP